VRERVLAARKRQALRHHGRPVSNASLSSREVREEIGLLPEGRALLEKAMERMGLSARSMDKVLKVARTIADLEGSEGVASAHVAEALQYRATSTAFSQ
jgi:magnesium chelatase family protein